MNTAKFRFHDELNDFLKSHRKNSFDFNFEGNPSVKDIIESFGIPHVEVEVIFANNISVLFDYNLKNGDDISVYPSLKKNNSPDIIRLKEISNGVPIFIVDIQLGKLARYLRMLGFDALYDNKYDSKDIINISIGHDRTILTRNVFLLKNSSVTKGYWIRSQDPHQQVLQVMRFSELTPHIKLFYRCMECNGILKNVDKELIKDRLLPNTLKYFDEFHMCSDCRNIYCKGSHFKKMYSLVEKKKHDPESSLTSKV